VSKGNLDDDLRPKEEEACTPLLPMLKRNIPGVWGHELEACRGSAPGAPEKGSKRECVCERERERVY
jgi:hypothetical protein